MPSKFGKLFHRSDRPTGMPVAQPIPPESAVPPGDIPKPLIPGIKVQPEEIRNLRELIRRRYELDIEIWSLRHVKVRDRDIVEDKMRRSDAALRKIRLIVSTWDDPSAFASQNEWAKLRDIRMRIEEGGKRIWAANPPWEEQILADRSIGVAPLLP